jgi:hypothetical protein
MLNKILDFIVKHWPSFSFALLAILIGMTVFSVGCDTVQSRVKKTAQACQNELNCHKDGIITGGIHIQGTEDFECRSDYDFSSAKNYDTYNNYLNQIIDDMSYPDKYHLVYFSTGMLTIKEIIGCEDIKFVDFDFNLNPNNQRRVLWKK